MKATKQSKKPAPVAAPVIDPKREHVARRRESFNVDDSGLTVLAVGDIVDLGPGLGGVHLIWKCNDCRATALPLTKCGTDRAGEAIYSASLAKPIGISPDSEVQILRRLGTAGMISFLEKQNKTTESEKSMAKDKTKKNEEAEEAEEAPAPKLGKLGGFHGFAITAVIRAMAVAGWEYWECKHVFEAEDIKVADNTIRIQLSAGRAGKGGAPADLSKKLLKSLRPSVDDKPAAVVRKTKAAKPAKKGKKADDDDEGDEDGEEADETPAPKKGKKKAAPSADDEDGEDEDEAPSKGSKEEEADDEDGDGE